MSGMRGFSVRPRPLEARLATRLTLTIMGMPAPIAAMVAIAAPAVAVTPAPTAVTLRAADGVVVHGLFYDAPRARATMLLFHQAGSSKGEYATIAPRLSAMGFAALAIDQRAGGGLFGRNETAAALHRTAGYAEAIRDLEAAFAWALAQHRPIILVGSSYSAALIFQLAARHPGRVAGVLAFSPGEYLESRTAVAKAAARVSAPVFVTSAADSGEIAAARAILSASPARVKVQFVPVYGVHGASTLIAARDPAGAVANWRAVADFLGRIAPRR